MFTVLAINLEALLSTALGVVAIATLAGFGLTRGQVTTLRESLRDAREETAAIRQSRADEREEATREKTETERLRLQAETAYVA
ncbi:MAG TPA: hypothetical protein VMZ71_12430, partial [Gemmataceae bacterium]|nr:hypothetical protein [Gemmataceae bacterium]